MTKSLAAPLLCRCCCLNAASSIQRRAAICRCTPSGMSCPVLAPCFGLWHDQPRRVGCSRSCWRRPSASAAPTRRCASCLSRARPSRGPQPRRRRRRRLKCVPSASASPAAVRRSTRARQNRRRHCRRWRSRRRCALRCPWQLRPLPTLPPRRLLRLLVQVPLVWVSERMVGLQRCRCSIM